mgnify:CR=1 FL=1
MRYLQTFHRRLRYLREAGQLSCSDIAAMCGVEEAMVQRWEAPESKQRSYPGVAELLDLCVKTETPLEQMLDMNEDSDADQLELPGLVVSNGDGLAEALKELEQEIERVRLSDEEMEILRRFRKASADNRHMVLQLLGG